jgi:predicted Ser/Thr protein kinase
VSADEAATGDAARPASPQRIGRYELLERIGKGGMGIVYRARDTVLGRAVAVKMLVADLEVSDETRERFFREARSAGQLAHRNIITIYDFGEENGRAYIVMELLQGESLTALLTREPDLPLEQRVDIMMRVCEGLAFAHSRAIVHRDVKPANLFITTDGQLKILDFGVARIASSNLTRSGLIVGTPDYMSPEQVQGRIVDQRSDVFSAGAVFYQLLTGRKPFAAKGLPMVLQKVVSDTPPPLRDVEAPPELAAIVTKALEKDPARRYQQMQDMVADLARFLQSFDQRTRELALKGIERFRAIEQLLAERRALGASLGLVVPAEGVAVVEKLSELPLFAERGAEVLRVVPFRRAAITDIWTQLTEQFERLSALVATWRSAAESMRAGEQAMSAGSLDAALTAFDGAARLVPDATRPAMLADRAEAEIATRRARGERAQAFMAEARQALAGGLWDLAADRLNQAESAAPWMGGVDDARREVMAAREQDAARRRAEIARLLGSAEQALRDADFEAADSLAREAAAFDEDSREIAAFNQRLSNARTEAAARDERARRAHETVAGARALFERGQRDPALRILRQALADDAALPGVAAELDRLAAEDRRLTEVARRQAEAAQKTQDAQAALDVGLLPEARDLAAAALALDPSNVQAIRVRAAAATRLAAAEAAERLAAEIDRLLADARAALQAGDLKRADRRAREALAKDPHCSAALDLLVDIAEVQRGREEAEERGRVRRAQDKAARPALKFAKAALAKGDYARAMWAAENALAIQPDSAEAQEILARTTALADRPARDTEDTVSLVAAGANGERDNTVSMQPTGLAAWPAMIVAWAGDLYRRITTFRTRTQ